jgi:hypothetical protein
MLAYLRIITVALLAVAAISVAPAMAGLWYELDSFSFGTSNTAD